MVRSVATDDQHKTLTEATSGSEREARFWLEEIRAAGRVEESWRQDAEKLVERYRNERNRERTGSTKLNLFYSNVETLKPRVYAQTPAPDVRRRRISEDPLSQATGRQVSTLLERALNYAIDAWDFDTPMKAVRDDMLVPGRGVARLDYNSEIITRRDVMPVMAPPIDPMIDPFGALLPPPIIGYTLDGQPVEPDFDDEGAPFVEQKINERVDSRYVFWADYRQSPARQWPDVWWVSFRHTFDREQLDEEFVTGPRATDASRAAVKDVPMMLESGKNSDGTSNRGGDDARQPDDPQSPFGRAVVWEVWNKRQRTRIWVAEGHDKVIRKDADPLRLEGFFPLPCPLYAIKTTDTMVPRPEFDEYKDQADELDRLQDRISKLTEVLKAVAVADGDAVEFLDIKSAKDGTVIPIGRPDTTAEDIDKSIWWWRVGEISQVIANLTMRAEQLKQQIFEIIGLGDLARGDPQPRVTAAAERFAGEFGMARMTPRSQPMAEFIRDMLRLEAEVMAEMFDPATLSEIGGMMVTPDMAAMLRDEKLRNVNIEVSTDSLLRPDKAAEKAEASEALSAVGGFLQQAIPALQVSPAFAPLLMAQLKAFARTFKWGRQYEDVLEQTADALAMQAQQAMAMQQAQASMMAAQPPGQQPSAPPNGQMVQ